MGIPFDLHSVPFNKSETEGVSEEPFFGPEYGCARAGEMGVTTMWKQTIPLLSDVIDLCVAGNIGMNLELKVGDNLDEETQRKRGDSLVMNMIKMLKEKNAVPIVTRVSSFFTSVLRSVKEASPELPIGILYNNYFFGEEGQKIRDQTPNNFAEFFFVNTGGSIEDSRVQLRPGLDAVHLCAETVTRQEIEKAHSNGVSVLVWFSGEFTQDEETFDYLEKLGVDTICTDRPDHFYKTVALGCTRGEACEVNSL